MQDVELAVRARHLYEVYGRSLGLGVPFDLLSPSEQVAWMDVAMEAPADVPEPYDARDWSKVDEARTKLDRNVNALEDAVAAVWADLEGLNSALDELADLE